MTVAELLDRIIAAYPGATAEALKTFKPVFYARLQRHEGPLLEAAANEVLGSFKPKYGQPFPIPADFEAHLPSGKLNLPSDGDSIRQSLKDRDDRKRRNFNAWHQGQGGKIKANRPAPVYNACVLMATQMAKTGALPLTAEQIKRCEDQALSQARAALFGPLPRTNEEWHAQLEQVRMAWANPQQVAA